ncbi:hypothetical protein L9F63_013090 [Diploptera punctata]|uniref:Disks large-associated protein 5 n=1 Tax=Diploptera punctata TaxID=6984 RepID=A0AAD8ACE1_DIPPU|nr:hypothetical protein L9F63_013090 [Diploptera punctata]
MNSRFRDQYKKSGVLKCSEEGRYGRAKDKLRERRVSRVDEFGKQRNLEEVTSNNQNDISDRKVRLQKWKEERNQKRAMQKKEEKPIFKVGVFHHKMGSSYLSDVSNLNLSKINRKRMGSSFTTCTSFAPSNFKFKAPVIKDSIVQAKENSSKPEITRKNVTSTAKHQPTHSQRVTRSQTRNLQNKEPSKDIKLKAKEKNGELQLKPRKQPKYSSSLATIDEKRKQKTASNVVENMNIGQNSAVFSIGDTISTERTGNEENVLKSEQNDVPTIEVTENKEINENMAAVKNSPCNENMAAVENSPSNNAALQLTSEQNKEVEFVYFDSPNVTKERGSSRKRKSSRRLRVIEEETDVLPYVSRMEEERKINGIIHFRSVLKSETERLESLCTSWEEISNTTPDLPQDANGTINAAIGQTKLLISKKFCKFRGLIDKCESGPTSEGEPILTCTDLEGFWDLVYLEVEKVDGSFNKLKEMRANNWKEDILENIPSKINRATKRGKKVQKASSSNALRSFISAARKKKSDLSSNSENSEELKSSSEETFIRTPKAIRSHESCYTPSSVRQLYCIKL